MIALPVWVCAIRYPMLPLATQDMAFWALAVLGTWNIVYGALCAMAQQDMKKLVAYSSISHMGYVMLGMATLTTQGINGAVLQMFNHGTITAMLFLLVGVIYDRAHHREIDGFGGLASIMPTYTGVMAIAFFAAMGLPGLSAFISEVLVLLGAWQYNAPLAIIAASAVVLTAGYMLWMLQRVNLGEPNGEWEGHEFHDVDRFELAAWVPLVVLIVAIGFFPRLIFESTTDTVTSLVEMAFKEALRVMPPTSAWCPRDATKNRGISLTPRKTGLTTVRSGRWDPPAAGSLVTNALPGGSARSASKARTLALMAPKWTGMWGALATRAPVWSKMAQE